MLLGCECKAESRTVEAQSRAKWTLSGCVGENNAGLSKVVWSEDVTSNGWTEATKELSAGETAEPTVEARNGAGYSLTIPCESVAAY